MKAFSEFAKHFQFKQISTTTKVWLFLSFLSSALIVGGYLLGSRHGLLLGFTLALSMNTFVFFYGDIRLHRLFKARLIEGQDPWGLLSTVQSMSHKLGIHSPDVYLLDCKTPTLFSFGVLIKRNRLMLSESLIKNLSTPELHAVLAFELSRIASGASVLATVASSLAGGIYYVASILDHILLLRFLRNSSRQDFGPIVFLSSPLMSLIIRCAVRQKSYTQADQRAAELTGSHRRMAEILWKLNSYHATIPLNVSIADAHLFIVNPLTSASPYRYFQVQPNVQQRIKSLIGSYPL